MELGTDSDKPGEEAKNDALVRPDRTALVCALALSGTAAAARPVIDTIVVDETVPVAIQCDGFALDVTAQGRIKVSTFLEDGQIALTA